MVFLGRKDFIPKKKAHTHRLCLLGRLIENIINHVWLLLNARFQIVRVVIVVISESLPFDQYHNRQSNGNEKEKNSRQDNTLQSWSLSVISYRMCDLWFGCVVGTITMFFIFLFPFSPWKWLWRKWFLHRSAKPAWILILTISIFVFCFYCVWYTRRRFQYFSFTHLDIRTSWVFELQFFGDNKTFGFQIKWNFFY